MYSDSFKSDNYRKSNREKKLKINVQNVYKNEAKWSRATTFLFANFLEQ